MKKQKMRGFLDPLSLGFVLSIVGTVTALSVDVDTQSGQDQLNAQVTLEESIELSKVDVD